MILLAITKPIIKTSFSYNQGSGNPASSTQARIYTLNYVAIISITDHHNQTILTPTTVNVSRNITLQPNEVFDATPQVSTVKREMIQELSSKLLNVLSSKKTTEALEKNQ